MHLIFVCSTRYAKLFTPIALHESFGFAPCLLQILWYKFGGRKS